jgi:hypothetical protein
MRVEVGRQQEGNPTASKAGISTASAAALPGKMHTKIDQLCEERDRLKRELPARKVGLLAEGTVDAVQTVLDWWFV